MAKKVLIISATPRKGGNSEILAQAFGDGAKAAGNEVEVISLRDKNLLFCKGCLACQKTGRCILKDDAAEITGKMQAADVLVFATPIYYYSVSGQLKTMLDRSNPLYNSDYKFRDVYLLSTAAENDPETPKTAEQVLQGFIDCFPKARVAGTVFAGGVTSPGDIQNHPALKTAYDAGKAV